MYNVTCPHNKERNFGTELLQVDLTNVNKHLVLALHDKEY